MTKRTAVLSAALLVLGCSSSVGTAGAKCGNDSQCATNVCLDGTCACSSDQAPCATDNDCCRVELSCRAGHCVAPPQQCQPPGAVCSEISFGVEIFDAGCCEGSSCRGNPRNAGHTCCVPPGASCTNGGECCTGLCDLTATCACIDTGGKCTASDDCCSFICHADGGTCQ